MSDARPSLRLLREMSDEAVARQLMENARLTRAELAVLTGLSKPTVSDAIRRLENAGLVCDTGERTATRGGVGTYYALTSDVGSAVAVNIAPSGVEAELIGADGTVRRRVVESVARPATPRAVTRILTKAVRDVVDGQPARLAVVSAADPVDKVTSALVQLPDAPFLVGPMSPARSLQGLVTGDVLVDNDVNWAALAERAERTRETGGRGADDFVYMYLGEGIGCAVVADGQVRRGHRGIAGEIAHVLVSGPTRRAMPLTQVFALLNLRHPGSTAIDVEQLLATLSDPESSSAQALIEAVCGVLDTAVAFCDPEFIVVGGPWGQQLVTALQEAFERRARSVPIEAPRAGDASTMDGVRAAAQDLLRSDIINRTRRQDEHASP